MNEDKRLRAAQVARLAGVSKQTLVRWITAHKIPEPIRDRNGWRFWTEAETLAVLEFANRTTGASTARSPEKQVPSTAPRAAAASRLRASRRVSPRKTPPAR
jgi:predicted DNA-binding transcriptional regulator AlpA